MQRKYACAICLVESGALVPGVFPVSKALLSGTTVDVPTCGKGTTCYYTVRDNTPQQTGALMGRILDGGGEYIANPKVRRCRDRKVEQRPAKGTREPNPVLGAWTRNASHPTHH